MTLIKLKDDEVLEVLPLYLPEICKDYSYHEDCSFLPVDKDKFTLKIEFFNSEDFNYSKESFYLDDTSVSETIKYLFSDTSKFSDLTAEEFKENLKNYLDQF